MEHMGGDQGPWHSSANPVNPQKSPNIEETVV